MAVEAVVFDLDGVLVDSEQVWDEARRELVRRHGGTWRDRATTDMLGMSSREWSRYVRDELGVDLEPKEINAAVVAEVEARYRAELPLLPGAVEAVERVAARWPLGLATSSDHEIVDLFLDLSGLRERFAVSVSSEEVGSGKPAPDVYLEACERLEADPRRSAAIEDSGNGLRAAHAAGMRVIAVPNLHFPPAPDALELADARIDSLAELTPELVEGQPGVSGASA
jgi:HAD superfamily hydrolase (TIGR01509 family)